MTSTRKVALPAALAERIRNGEEVNGEEVTAALEAERARLDKEEREGQEGGAQKSSGKRRQDEPKEVVIPSGVDIGWLPPNVSTGAAKGAGRRKRK